MERMRSKLSNLVLPIEGMDCAECALHVRSALAGVPGVRDVQVSLVGKKAVLLVEGKAFDMEAARRAVSAAGYSVPDRRAEERATAEPFMVRHYGLVVAGVFLAVALVVLAEFVGLLGWATRTVPWPLWLLLVLALGYPNFLRVLRASLAGTVTSHTLMTVGALATMAVGEWAAALLIVAFMRLGAYVEGSTTERARGAVRDLARLAPTTARVERGGQEMEVPIQALVPGDVVIVRPGERVPVDGIVLAGRAVVDTSTITGEAMPVEAGVGKRVYASSIVQGGMLKVRAEHVGEESTYGRILRMIEEAEGNKGRIGVWADRFSGYYLPMVGLVGAMALVIRGDPLAMAAVLAVACSCAFALAAPVAQLAAIGAAARSGILVRGGRFLELLSGADLVLVDKTGTVTFGKPSIDEVVSLGDLSSEEVLSLAASAERYSSHPLAWAVVAEAQKRGLSLKEPEAFSEETGVGVRATVEGRVVAVGRTEEAALAAIGADGRGKAILHQWATEGKTGILVWIDGKLAGALAAVDSLRPEVTEAIQSLKSMGLEVRIVTGDRDEVAATIAQQLEVEYRAGLLPHQKVEVVKAYQAQGRRVVMVGDGINDAAALVQADVGIAMMAGGVALPAEVSHVVLMRDDWTLVPWLVQLARKTMATVKLNLGFTALYNLLGVGLAFSGLLPPAVAASAQSLPDVAILANSSRLLGHGSERAAL